MKFEEIVKPKEEFKYPVLKKDPYDEMVMLFIAPSTGIIVDVGTSLTHSVGQFSKTWEEEEFTEIVHGTLTFD